MSDVISEAFRFVNEAGQGQRLPNYVTVCCDTVDTLYSHGSVVAKDLVMSDVYCNYSITHPKDYA